MRTIASKKKKLPENKSIKSSNDLLSAIREIKEIVDSGLKNRIDPSVIMDNITKAIVSSLDKNISDLKNGLSEINTSLKKIEFPKQMKEADFDIRRDVNDKMIGFNMKVIR